ncbi:MAG: FHA domain-containing protein [Candidatus Promineifilaceae bacterium]|nr:FHA domain-containing protein [Candidatus Promineifilaceae bacterium]
MRKVVFSLMLLLFLLAPALVLGQDVVRLEITSEDATGFPEIAATILATDGESRRIANLGGISVAEDGQPVSDVELLEAEVGVEVIFVIDANRDFDSRDGTNTTRREKVRDSINRFAFEYMSDAQLDRVSIIVPEEQQPRLLLERALFPTEVINEINFYDPQSLSDTPLNEMLTLALEQATTTVDEGRFQAIVLFSDGGNLDNQLNYEALVNGAQAINIPIFGVILGAEADPQEQANLGGLADPTRGTIIHMPEPAAADPVYETIATNRVQSQVVYRSSLSEPGSHVLSVSYSGVEATADFDLDVQPPAVSILLEPGQTIRRVAASADAPLAEAEPTSQLVRAQVLWPDGHPRGVASAALLVNGVERISVPTPELDESDSFSLEWDISQLGEGSYDLSISVVDEVGIEGVSDPLPVNIALEGVAESAASAGEVEPEEIPTTAATQSDGGLTENLGVLGLVFGLLALVVAIALVVVVVVLLQRRREPAAQPAATATAPAAAAQSEPPSFDETQVMRPAFAKAGGATAYLEPVENAPGQPSQIEVPGGSVTIGRDPRLAQVVFKDKSVSRLHARITERGGVYQLFDEGSASGTYVNYEPVGLTPQTLRDNDDIHIGRVHVRFHVEGGAADDDSTQIMPAPKPPQRPQEAEPAGDDMSTQPYMPNQPQAPTWQPPADDDDDEDDVSTEPFMPHTPQR